MKFKKPKLDGFPELPIDVLEWLRKVFAECNDAISSQITRIPTIQETFLDMTFIVQMSKYAAPFKMPSDWVVNVQTHYLGGMRHWMEKWEIADIGILISFRQRGKIIKTKLALMQSKRLYPDEQDWDEETIIDYGIGFARLATSDHEAAKLLQDRTFTFQKCSRFKALVVGDDQYVAIEQYENARKIPVYYLLYNPMKLPWSRTLPADSNLAENLKTEIGCRVIASSSLREALKHKPKMYKPSYSDALESGSASSGGQRLESFIVDRVLGCQEGYLAKDFSDEGIQYAFYRRSGPIAAAIAVTIDAP